jgi:PPOX class probable FMN-dependent enzyme
MSIWNDFEGHVADLSALRRIYPEAPGETALAKEAPFVHPLYRPYIEASPFVVLSTLGPQGLDASPRGDAPGFVQVADGHTLLLPDRRGNHRLDSLKNVLHDPRVALLFMIPGIKETLRVNGIARISASPALLERFVVDGKPPRSVLVIKVQKVFFQCGRALIRSKLWSDERPVLAQALPTPGSILQALSGNGVDGEAYDAALPARQASTLY